MQHAAPTAPTPAWYRIQDPQSQLYIRFTCCASPDGKSRVTARLTRRDRASRFSRHSAAAECFARFLYGEPLEIVRSDA